MPLLAIVAVAACWMWTSLPHAPAAAALADHQRGTAGPWQVRGRLASDPERRRDFWTVDLVVDSVRVDGVWRRLPLRVGTNVYDARAEVDWIAGHGFEAFLQLRRDHGARNPPLRLPPPLEAMGLDARSSLKSFQQLRRRAPTSGSLSATLRAAVRAALQRRLDDYAPLGKALLLGERGEVTRDLRDALARTGLLHLLAVSGLHVGIMLGAVYMLGRLVGLAKPIAGAATLLLGLPAVVVLVSPRPSVARGAAMAALVLCATVSGRRGHAVDALSVVVVGLVVVNPWTVRDLGFQFSVLATAAILTTLPGRGGAARSRGIAALLHVSCAAQLAVIPLVAAQSFRVAPLAPLLNLIAVPAVSVALVGSWIAVLCDLAGVAWGARGVGYLSYAALSLFDWWARTVDQFIAPVAVSAAALPAITLVAWLSLIAASIAASVAAHRAAASVALAGGLLAVAALGGLFGRGAVQPGAADFTMVVLDIGQGDAILVQEGARAMLIDTGGSYNARFDPGVRVLAPMLRARGSPHLDTVAITHLDADHVGGFAGLAREIDIREVWFPALIAPRAATEAFAAASPSRFRSLSAGQRLNWGACGVDVLSPDIGAINSTSNDASLVFLLQCGQRAVLLTGDSEAAAEARYGPTVPTLPATIVKSPHHGSATSSTAALLDRVTARHVVVSAGWRNRFGHPHESVLAAYRARGLAVYRTDRDGAVRLQAGRRITVSAPRWTAGRGRVRSGGWLR